MNGRIGDEPNMAPYKDVIESGAVQFLDFTPRDIAAMNLRDAAEHRAAQARAAHPRYKRHGQIDIITGEWHSYTAEELAEQRWVRAERRSLVGLVCVVLACAIGAIAIVIAFRAGWV